MEPADPSDLPGENSETMDSEKGKSSGILSPKRVSARERAREAIRLRIAGWSFDAIARKLGYTSPARAYEAIQRTLDRTVQEPADELRAVTVDRLDRLLAAIWPLALGLRLPDEPPRAPDLQAVDRCLAIESQRARLLGLNTPDRVDVRSIVSRIAEERGYDEQEKQAATAYVENYIRSLRARP